MSMSPARRAHLAAALLPIAVLGACSSSDGPTANETPKQGITAVAGGAFSDTVLVTPLQALIVEVRGPGGALAKGSTVRFSVRPTADSTRRYQSPLFVCRLSATTCGSGYGTLPDTVASDTADATGRAKVTVRLGTIAGPAWVYVSVPEFGMRDSVPFTVLPGAARTVRFAVRDTNMLVAGRASLRASVLDAYGNRRTDAVTYALGTGGSSITVDAAGATVTAADIGTGTVLGRVGSAVDTLTVRVVPAGRLLVWDNSGGVVRMLNTDGTAPRTLMSGLRSDFGAFPKFSPSGTLVAGQTGVQSYGGSPQRIMIVDSAGTNARTVDLPAGVLMMTYPRPMADGTVRFIGRTVSGYYYSNAAAALYSIASDGTVSRVANLPGMVAQYAIAEISPDGSRVAFVSLDPFNSGNSGLRVVTVATGQVVTIESNGWSPAWSPQGDKLAYLVPSSLTYNTGVDGGLVVANADGTGRTALSTQSVFSPGLGWSPNGTYVVGRLGANYGTSAAQESGLRAVRPSDGVGVTFRLPAVSTAGAVVVGQYGDYYQPDWR